MEIKTIEVGRLNPYEKNARTHGEEQISEIMQSIRRFGFCNPILADAKLTVIAGHGRLEAAKRLGLGTVPVIILSHLSDAERRALTLADNRIAERSGWDLNILAEELAALSDSEISFDGIGFDESEINDLLNADFDYLPQTFAEPKKIKVKQKLEDTYKQPDEIKTDIVIGDLFEIGEHRLLCGDSGDIAQVAILMAGKKADMVFTDPPYGLAYVGKTKDALTIENDNIAPEKLKELSTLWFNGVDFAANQGAYLLATVPAGPLHLIFAQDWLDRGWLRQIMVWNKSAMVLGHSEYHYKHEPILFGWKQGGARLKSTDRTKTTVWDFNKPNANREHPTMKPVEMWAYGIGNHTNAQGLLYEPFLGSGTTMVAAHQLGRRCYGMELDPKYCQVSIDRMRKLDPSLSVVKNGEKLY